MKQFTTREVLRYGGLVMLALIIVRSWDSIISFLGIVLSAFVPLILGAAIAYAVRIPTSFIERHLLPHNHSKLVEMLRHPVSIFLAIILILVGLFLATSVFIPAFTETVTMASSHSEALLYAVLRMPLPETIKDAIRDFMAGDVMQSISRLDIMGLLNGAMGGTVGTISMQLFGVVNMLMTGFFGILFSIILLTDTTDVWQRVFGILMLYVGQKRMERISLVLGVADASFHNFIVRQCLEAAILGSVGTIALFIMGFRYALGIGVFMALCALVPIVGYPVGLICCSLMVAISTPWMALVYAAVVVVAQVCEATFVLPHVGDPRTVLPPVITTIGVTIGGGVAGFVGMLIAIPTAATIRQLIMIDANRRRNKIEQNASSDSDEHVGET